MSLLLDTHAFVWWRAQDRRLGEAACRAIADAERIFVSAASAWEAAIKISKGKLKLPEPFEQGAKESGFGHLAITFDHAQGVIDLPWLHRDPFDRMLIAQARFEGLTIVTADGIFSAYGIPVIAT